MLTRRPGLRDGLQAHHRSLTVKPSSMNPHSTPQVGPEILHTQVPVPFISLESATYLGLLL